MIKKRKIISSLLGLIILFSLFISCEDNPVTPNEPPPGRSDYIVTVDTIDRNYTVHNSIWGTSENNMWAVGSGSEDLWHYDGVEWKSILPPLSGSQNSIYGFDENDIFIAADEGRIYHYNGSEWYQHYRYRPDGNNYYSFNDIWGYSSSDLYAVGHYYENSKSYGIVFHFDGTEWERIDIQTTEGQIYRIRGDFSDRSKQYFIINNGDLTYPDSSRIFELTGEEMKEIYCGELFSENASAPLMESIGQKLFFGFKRKIHSYNDAGFTAVRSIGNKNYFNWFNGRTINDLILATADGFVHFNGYYEKPLYQNNNTLVAFDFIVTDSAFFAVAHDYDNRVNLVIKGVLQNKME